MIRYNKYFDIGTVKFCQKSKKYPLILVISPLFYLNFLIFIKFSAFLPETLVQTLTWEGKLSLMDTILSINLDEN